MNRPVQPEFDFAAGHGDGLIAWREQRRAVLRTLVEKVGLPLGRRVEVRLVDGVVLEGILGLDEDTLFPEQTDTANLRLAIGRVDFRHSDIEACVCRD